MDRFWEHGFEAVSVSQLADAMSINRSSFYNTFGGREAVFREALDVYRRIAPDAALGAVKPGENVRTAVRDVFREICRVRAADPQGRGCLVVNSAGELIGTNKALGGYIEQAMRDGVGGFEKLIDQAVDQQEIEEPPDIHVAANAFMTFLIGLNTVSKVIRNEGELWKICENFLASHGFGERRGAGN